MKSTLIAISSAVLLIESAFAQARGAGAGAGGRPLVVNGELLPFAEIEVKPQVRGRVEKVHVREGDVVKTGALLMELANFNVEDKSLLRVLAPKDGTVLRVTVVEQQFIDDTTTFLSIADRSRLIIETRLSLADVSRLAPKQDVKFTSAATGAGVPLDARILFVAPVATVGKGGKGFVVQAVIEKPDPRLRFGMPVQVTIPAK